jgi:hypothetical protein
MGIETFFKLLLSIYNSHAIISLSERVRLHPIRSGLAAGGWQVEVMDSGGAGVAY